jgi:hypothetical protein
VSVAWVQTVTPAGTTSPAVTGSFTPSAGDQIPVFGANTSGSATTMTVTGTGSYSSLATLLSDGATGKTLQPWANSNCSGGAQTVTNTGATGNAMFIWAFEYSGATSVTAQTSVLRSSPGAGTGAILGTSVTVPAGAILLALCTCESTTTATITSPSGTNRGSGTVASTLPYCVTEYAGAGAAIQPSFTCSVGASNSFAVMQILLQPSTAAPVLMGGICL